MAEWKMFPLWDERPDGLRQFSKKERNLLELTIAGQVSDLLGRHGLIDDTEIDVSECLDFDEPKTFLHLAMEEEVELEDGGELSITQIPWRPDGFVVEFGAHSVEKTNENDELEVCLTVWDPAINAHKRIHDEEGKTVSRLVLQELYEALTVITFDLETNYDPCRPSFVPHEYPQPLIEPELLDLSLQLRQ